MDTEYEQGNTRKLEQLTAGDDQLPHESAKVTKGSGQSKPKMLRIVTSSFFIPLGWV